MKRHSRHGFTLVELAITVAIAGILAAIAIPAYSSYVLRGKRADGKTSLMKLQFEQEKYRSNNPTYGSMTDLGFSTSSANGDYTIAIPSNTATGYTATAAPRGNQMNDSCGTLTLTVSSGSIAYTPANCWTK